MIKKISFGLFIGILVFGAYSYCASSSTFTFSAAGDFGANPNTIAVLTGMAQTKPDFVLALGDLKYNDLATERLWSDFVKKYIGAAIPFLIVSGNHEENGPDGHIEEFLKEFPDPMSSRGLYGKEYYFDYPKRNPIARFIFVSPDLNLREGPWGYLKGDVHYQWLSKTIDEGRSKNIPWTLVSYHKPNLTIGQKRGEVKDDILNLLIDKKVDLVLAGHDHNYQRTYPLAHGLGCPEVVSGGFNSHCVAENKMENDFQKNRGTIFMVVGTGGRSIYPMSSVDEEFGYFTEFTRTHLKSSFGYLKIKITEKELLGEFIPTSDNTALHDRFTIKV